MTGERGHGTGIIASLQLRPGQQHTEFTVMRIQPQLARQPGQQTGLLPALKVGAGQQADDFLIAALPPVQDLELAYGARIVLLHQCLPCTAERIRGMGGHLHLGRTRRCRLGRSRRLRCRAAVDLTGSPVGHRRLRRDLLDRLGQ